MPNPIHIIERNRSLTAELASTLAQAENNFLARFAIVVPGKRLMNYIKLHLTQELKACIPPKIITLDELAKVLPADSRRPISSTTRHIILSTLISQTKTPFIQPGMESDLARFFDEIADAGCRENIFDQIKTLLHEDQFYDERHIEQLEAQTLAWQKLYAAYREFLTANNLTDRAHDILDRVTKAEESGQTNFPKFADHYYVIGFVDATAIQIRLLNLLQRHASTEFWFHCDASALQQTLSNNKAISPLRPLANLLEQLHLKPQFGEQNQPLPHVEIGRRLFRLSRQNSALRGAQIRVHTAHSPMQEVKAAIACARQLIIEKKIAPEKIVIAVPDEAVYGDLLWALCTEAELPVNFALGIPAVRTQTGQWLRLMLDIFTNDGPITTLLDIFNNKLVNPWLKSIDSEFDKNACVRQLQLLATKYNRTSGLEKFYALAQQHQHEQLTAVLRELLELAKPFLEAAERNLEDWSETLWGLTEKTGLHEFVQKNPGAYNLENRILSLWLAGLQQLSLAAEIIKSKFSGKNFVSLILKNILNSQIRPAGQPFIGVQILGLLELRGLSPEATIILGNCEGLFPAGPGRELFYSQPIRGRLGLTTTFKLENLYDQQFFNLIMAAPVIELFCSATLGDDPMVQSRYLQRLRLFENNDIQTISFCHANSALLAGDRLLAETELDGSSDYSYSKKLCELQQLAGNRLDEPGKYAGDRGQVLSHYSATTLKFLLLCPYCFLLTRLKVNDASLPEEELQAKDIGTWLHLVCQYFFTGIPDAQLAPLWPDLLDKWQRPVTQENFDSALDRLQRIARTYAFKLGEHREDIIYMEDLGWRHFLQHEMELGETLSAGNHVEIACNYALPEIEQIIGCEADANIRIDRLVQKSDKNIIIDYKKTKPETSNFKEGREPQLPFYFHLLSNDTNFQNDAEWLAQYRDFSESSRKPFDEAKLDEAWQNILQNWQDRLQKLMQNESGFSVEPGPKTCNLCDFSGICRHQERPQL